MSVVVEATGWLLARVADLKDPHKFIGFGAMDVTKPYKFMGFGAFVLKSSRKMK